MIKDMYNFFDQWRNNSLMLLNPKKAMEWGSYEFVKYDPKSVNKLSIPETSKAFLIDIGLPKKVRYYLRFDIPYLVLPPITDIRPEWPNEYLRYRLLGVQAVSHEGKIHVLNYVCLDENTNGQVAFIKLEDHSIDVINSSVEQMANYFLIFRQYFEWRLKSINVYDPSLSENENYIRWEEHQKQWSHKVSEIANQLRKIDPLAENSEYWGMAITEIENFMI